MYTLGCTVTWLSRLCNCVLPNNREDCMENKESKKEKEFIDGLVKEQPVTKAFQKLNREPLEISVYRHTSSIQDLESELALIDEALSKVKEDSDKATLVAQQEKVKKELTKLEEDKIDGVLTKLTYRDINDIKAAVTEAVLHFQEYNFDQNVMITRIVAEERFMTVFCALKKKNNHNQKYFANLEEIAQVDDVTIFDLYNKWEAHYVLTDDEIKN